MDRTIKNPLYAVVSIAFILFIAFPVVYTFGMAVFAEGSLSPGLFENGILSLLLKSGIIALLVALLSTILGTALGFLVYRTNIIFRDVFKVLLLIPLVISPYILAVAWKDVFLNFFSSMGHLSAYFGVILVLTSIYTPLSMLVVGSALSNIDVQFEEAGLMMTKFHRVLFKIVLPLIKPALLSSLVLVFIFSISEFSVPAFFSIRVFTTEIFTQFSAFYNHSTAIMQSVALISICFLLLFAEGKYISDAPFLSMGGKGVNDKRNHSQGRNWPGLIFLSSWLFISVIVPMLLLVIQSFNGGTGRFIQAWGLLMPTFGTSIGLAFSGALIIVLFAFIIARSGNKIRGSKSGISFDYLVLFIFAIPSTTYGISLIKFYNQPILNSIYSSYLIILIAYVGKFLFISTKLISNALKQIPKSLDEAAQLQGVKAFSRILKIQIPLIMPTLLTAFVISFIYCIGELGTTIMVYPPGSELMPIKIYTIMANAPQALTSSMTLIVFTITLLPITGFYFLIKRLKKY